MLHYFSRPDVRAALNGKDDEVVKRFQELCDKNSSFRASLETTTKSVNSNRTRFNMWGTAVSDLSGVNLEDLMFSN